MTDRVPLPAATAPLPRVFVQERDFAARQELGRRSNQEDYYAFADGADLFEPPLHRLLLVVGDGLGAHAGGSVASYLAVNAFVRAFHEQPGGFAERLHGALDTANDTIGFLNRRMPTLAMPMGTTLVAALVSAGSLEWISVGDSLLFLYRDGTLRRLNADHSLAPVLDAQVQHGVLSADEAAQHPERHTLQSAVLGLPLTLVDRSPEPLPLQSGDLVLVASDGLLTLSAAELEELLALGRRQPAEKIAEALLFAIRRADHARQDNATVALVKIP